MTSEDLQRQHAQRSQALSERADSLLQRMGALSLHSLRLELARLGWTSSVEVSSEGWGDKQYGFGFRLRRWDWHGRRTAGDPQFSAFLASPRLGVETAEAAIRRTAQYGLAALRDFPDCLPRLQSGTLRRDPLHDGLFSTPMEFYSHPEWPTESIPANTEAYDDAPFADLLVSLVEAGRRGWNLRQELSWLGFNTERTKTDRKWGMNLKLMVHGRFGCHEMIMPYYHRTTSETLLASTNTRLATGVLAEMDILALAYGKYRPPGMMTVTEYIVAEEMNLRAKEDSRLAAMQSHMLAAEYEEEVEFVMANRRQRLEEHPLLAEHFVA